MTYTAEVCISTMALLIIVCISFFIAGKESLAIASLFACILHLLFVNGLFCAAMTSKTDVAFYRPDTITRTKSLIILTKGPLVISSNDVALYGLPDSSLMIRETSKFNYYGGYNSDIKEIAQK